MIYANRGRSWCRRSLTCEKMGDVIILRFCTLLDSGGGGAYNKSIKR